MFRKAIAEKLKSDKNEFKFRGHEVRRIEAFSDAVFAFAVTLLIVSLEVPKSFGELTHIAAIRTKVGAVVEFQFFLVPVCVLQIFVL